LLANLGSTKSRSPDSAYPPTHHNAGHSDPRTTLTYIRNRDRLSDSPAYLLKY